jgi:Holliday junction resolvase RusA-like endonuclease
VSESRLKLGDHKLTIRVDGKPVPKGRPKFWKGRAVTPPERVEFEERVAAAWKATYGDLSLGGALQAFLYFGSFWHSRTDIDNFVKSALDGLQRGGAFTNGDEQVYKITASKFPATRDEQHTIIVLKFYDYNEDV